jgi:hypothetical protein
MFKVAGVITDGELLRLRKFGSRLQGHGPVKWKQFQVRYRKELREKKDALKLLKQKSKEHTVTLVHGARNEEHNEALVLKRGSSPKRVGDNRLEMCDSPLFSWAFLTFDGCKKPGRIF